MNSHHLPASPRRFEGGIHPKDGKELSVNGEIRSVPLLDKYMLVIQQNIGAPPKLLVKKGDQLSFFDRIAFFHQQFRGRADVLLNDQHVFVQQRHGADLAVHRQFFPVFGMDPAFEAAGRYRKMM